MGFSLDREKLVKDYSSRLPLLKALKKEATRDIILALETKQIKFHSVTARVKSFDSIVGKAEAKEVEAPLDDLVDIVGIRVVALFLADIEKIVDMLTNSFDVQSVDDKIQDGDHSKFGYLSVPLHAKIKSSFSGTRYDHIKRFLFEIQIRTIAMDAWASASRYWITKVSKIFQQI
jgi:putative GTP pyrophosphokinase